MNADGMLDDGERRIRISAQGVEICGYAYGAKIRVHHRTRAMIVIHVGGFSYNPGSRNSMLKDYAPAHFQIYEIASEATDAYGETIVARWIGDMPTQQPRERRVNA